MSSNTGSSENPQGTTTLLMGFHCHQPVGNFESVLAHGCRVCYGPLLEELERHPSFKFSIHMSGHLLEWIAEKEKGIFDLLAATARRGQAELFTAGFYEPVLTVIPPRDALDQIALLSDMAQEISGRRPQGLWLTERIWDPSLVPLLREAGVRYTIVDDNHLIASGHGGGDLTGYFITETRGEPMALYPISQRLRYATPFKPVPEALKAVEEAGSGRGGTAIVFDDGEKFGMWPDTAQWVYGQGWLRDFLTAVCDSGRIRTQTFEEHFQGSEPMGRVHLAPGSYIEMQEWTLPPADAKLFEEVASRLEDLGLGAAARRFLRGGLWPDFLVRYSESNNMHKKMTRISARTLQEGVPEARKALFRGQCNDAYWHGIFGGLYLPVLRNGVKMALNEAEGILDRTAGLPPPLLGDINLDGYQEAEVRSTEAIAVVTAPGGNLYELSDKESRFDLLGTLTRRREHYHDPTAGTQHESSDGVATIHESMRSMSDEARRKLVYDRQPRHSFIDRFLPAGSDAAGMMAALTPEYGDFASGSYDLSVEAGTVLARRRGTLSVPGSDPVPVTIRKRFTLKGRRLDVDYEITCEESVGEGLEFACEVNLHPPSQVHCGADLDGRSFSLEEAGGHGPGERVTIADPVLPAPLTLRSSRPGSVWWYPVQTVSQSEGGFEVTWQGSSIGFRWKLEIAPSEALSLGMTLEF